MNEDLRKFTAEELERFIQLAVSKVEASKKPEYEKLLRDQPQIVEALREATSEYQPRRAKGKLNWSYGDHPHDVCDGVLHLEDDCNAGLVVGVSGADSDGLFEVILDRETMAGLITDLVRYWTQTCKTGEKVPWFGSL